MCECNGYVTTSSDEESIRDEDLVVANRLCKLVLLNFTTYELCGDAKRIELGIPLLEFDKSKLSVARCETNPNNFDVLYDGKKFRVFDGVFS